jgi:antitoxin component of RelBE/YafQ-DinJ toxin-antitoxin module
MDLTISIDDQTMERARDAASAMGRDIDQLIREHLEQLVARSGIERDITAFRELSNQQENKSRRSWKFNREEIYDRDICSRREPPL